MPDLILIILAYILGSLSSAIIICKLTGLPDPRKQGSGNPGATNVLRFGGKKIAILVLLGDMLKGLIPVLLAKSLALPPSTIAAVCLAAFLGHLYPVFFRFKGGKGVATALGVILGLSWMAGLALIAIWLLSATLFRISSLSALIAATISPLIIWLSQPDIGYLIMSFGISALLIWRHKKNIRNIIQGKEPRIGKK
ncbi:MAG: glycerol-3-phosphate 1-O-acyltransferase PlsY [Gammaproteobacteria bacterium]